MAFLIASSCGIGPQPATRRKGKRSCASDLIAATRHARVVATQRPPLYLTLEQSESVEEFVGWGFFISRGAARRILAAGPARRTPLCAALPPKLDSVERRT